MKSYAVVHMQKFKNHDLKGIQFHNQRERESKSNPDINKEKSHLNYDLHNQESINYNKKVDEIIKNNVITNRKIRKDAVRMCNFIVTSDKGFFENLSKKEQDQFFKKSYEFFKDRYGEDKIVSAMVHLDEATPHMHLALVPVIENKLSAKRLFDRKELLAIQKEYPEFIQGEGFNLQRGQEGSDRKHLTTQEFKEEKIKELDKDIEKKKVVLEKFNQGYPKLLEEKQKEIDGVMERLNSTLDKLSKAQNDLTSIQDDIESSLDTKKALKSEIGALKSIRALIIQLEDYKKIVEENNPSYIHVLMKNRSEVVSENEDYKDFIKENNLENDFEDYLEKINQKILEMNLEDEWDLEM